MLGAFTTKKTINGASEIRVNSGEMNGISLVNAKTNMWMFEHFARKKK